MKAEENNGLGLLRLPSYEIDMGKLWDKVESIYSRSKLIRRGFNKGRFRTELGEILFWRGDEGDHDHESEAKRWISDRSSLPVKRFIALELIQLFNKLDEEVLKPEEFLASLAPDDSLADRQEVQTIPSRDAEAGQIEIVTQGRENLVNAAIYDQVARYVSVHVDQVRFYKKDPVDQKIKVSSGQYIRIGVPGRNNGAVVLPVDAETGDVLLVTQYRHNQGEYLTEAPRGFGHIGADESEQQTAMRELVEETGREPLKTAKGYEIHFLRSAYTDTGKLWERPRLFFAYVSREGYEKTLNEANPAMEDPCWVSLRKFEKALYTDREIQLWEGDYHFASSPRHLDKMRAETKISKGILSIDDAFTLQVGLLAMPILKKRFRRLFQGDDL